MSQTHTEPKARAARGASAPMADGAALPFAGAAETMNAALEQSREYCNAAVQNWTAESRSFLEGMARDGAEALKQLQACKSPFDVVAVEQSWLMARASAYLDAGMRMVAASLHQAETAAAEVPAFRLPE